MLTRFAGMTYFFLAFRHSPAAEQRFGKGHDEHGLNALAEDFLAGAFLGIDYPPEISLHYSASQHVGCSRRWRGYQIQHERHGT